MIFKTTIVNGKRRTLIVQSRSKEEANEDSLKKAVLAIMGTGFEFKEEIEYDN